MCKRRLSQTRGMRLLTARIRSSYEYMNYLQVVQVNVRTPTGGQYSIGADSTSISSVGKGFISTIIIAQSKTAVSCQKTVYTKLLTPPFTAIFRSKRLTHGQIFFTCASPSSAASNGHFNLLGYRCATPCLDLCQSSILRKFEVESRLDYQSFKHAVGFN